MLTFRDAELLNNAFGNLDETLMRNRMMKLEQSRQQQEQQRLAQNEAATQAYRNQELGLRAEGISDEELQRQIANKKASGELAERTRHDKAMEADADSKQKVTLYTPDGSSVVIPKIQADAYKQNFATSHPGQQLSDTNPFYKELNVGGQTLGFNNLKDYDKAALAWQTHQDNMNKDPDSTTTRIITGTGVNGPIDETNVTQTVRSPKSMPMSGPATTTEARVRVKSPDGRMGSIPQSQLQDALNSGYTRVQ